MDKEAETSGDPPVYSPEGVDLTLVRWFLTLTPEERLEYVQDGANSIESLKEHA